MKSNLYQVILSVLVLILTFLLLVVSVELRNANKHLEYAAGVQVTEESDD